MHMVETTACELPLDKETLALLLVPQMHYPVFKLVDSFSFLGKTVCVKVDCEDCPQYFLGTTACEWPVVLVAIGEI